LIDHVIYTGRKTGRFSASGKKIKCCVRRGRAQNEVALRSAGATTRPLGRARSSVACGTGSVTPDSAL